MALVLRFNDEHDHRKLRVVGDARDAVGRALECERFTELRPIRAKFRTEHLHRAIALRLESTQSEVVTQRVVGDERMERSPLPNNLLACGGEHFSKRSGFFIVERHALDRVSKRVWEVGSHRLPASHLKCGILESGTLAACTHELPHL